MWRACIVRVWLVVVASCAACGSARAMPTQPTPPSASGEPRDGGDEVGAPSIDEKQKTPPPVHSAPAALPQSAFGDHWVTGRYDFSQQEVLEASAIPFEDLTHLDADLGVEFVTSEPGTFNVARATLKEGAEVKQGGAALARFSELAHAHGVKALLHMGAYHASPIETLARLLSDDHREQLTNDVIRTCTAFGFDGIVWEHYDSKPLDTALFFAALKDKRPDLLIATDSLGAGHSDVLPGHAATLARAVAPYVDHFYLRMTDGIGNDAPWSVWHLLPLFNAFNDGDPGTHPFDLDKGVKLYTQAEPPLNVGTAKFGIEMPMWGVAVGPLSPDSEGAQMTEPGVRLAGPNDWSLFSWGRNRRDWPLRHVAQRFAALTEERWDDEAKASYLSFWPPLSVSGYETETLVPFRFLSFISYESPRAATEKGRYLRCNGFGGASVHSLNDAVMGDGGIAVLRALANALKQPCSR
jgi:chitinase